MDINNKSNGFTLIELLIVLAISLTLMTGVYATYQTQQKAYMVQDQVAAMQQNVRAAMHFLERDLMMAGFDPYRLGGAEVTVAANDSITFTFYEGFDNINNDSDTFTDEADELTLETVVYELYDALQSDSENDLLDDDLSRKEGSGTPQPLALNIQAIDLVYLDEDGNQLGDTDWDFITDSMTAADRGNIRTIEVTLVGKTNDLAEGIWVDTDYTNSNVYTNAQGGTVYTAPGDNLRRMSLTKRVLCRNLGN